MTLAVVTAVHLYGRARSNDYRARTALGLAGAGVLTVSIPFAALATSVDIECSDSAGVSFEPGLGVVAIVLASCVLFWLVVVVAQVAVGRATLWATKALTAAAVAGFSEFVFTWIELEHHCNRLGDWRPWHLSTGVVVAGWAGLLLRWRMQAQRGRAGVGWGGLIQTGSSGRGSGTAALTEERR